MVRFGLHRLVSMLRAALALLLMLPCLVYLIFSGCVLLIPVARPDAHHPCLIAPRTLATEDLLRRRNSSFSLFFILFFGRPLASFDNVHPRDMKTCVTVS